jgi:hypothetical protein
MPIDASPSGTLDIENATLRSRNIVSLTSMVAGNDVVRSSAAPTLEVYGDPSHGGTEPTLELVSNTSNTVSTTFTRLTSNAGVFTIQSGTDGTADSKGDIAFSSVGGTTEHMRIQGSTGNVGIGTDSPDTMLEVAGNAKISSVYRETFTVSSVATGTYVYLGRFSTQANAIVEIASDGVSQGNSNKFEFQRQYDATPHVSGIDSDHYLRHRFFFKSVNVLEYDLWHYRDGTSWSTAAGNMTYRIQSHIYSKPSDPGSSGSIECKYSLYITNEPGSVKVGIRTNAPEAVLHVNGHAQFGNASIKTGGPFGSGSGGVYTGINLNGGTGGGVVLLFVSVNSSGGNASGAWIFAIRKHYGGAGAYYPWPSYSTLFANASSTSTPTIYSDSGGILKYTFGVNRNTKWSAYEM